MSAGAGSWSALVALAAPDVLVCSGLTLNFSSIKLDSAI